MAFYRFADPDYFEAITPEELRFSQNLAREIGLDVGSVILGEDGDMEAPMVSVLKFAPGGVLPRHAHDCYRMEVVIQGSIDTGEDAPLGPGDTMISRPGEFYGPNVAGPDGATTVEVFSVARADIDFAPVEDPEMTELFSRAQREFGGE